MKARGAVVMAALAACAALAGCAEKRDPKEAEQAVRRYLERLCDAYRASDASLVDPLVGEEHGLKLLGLIGVKRDAGIVLDAKVLDLQFTRVTPEGQGWVVETSERWAYKDVKIGAGVQVGQASTDQYAMRYRFDRKDGKLLLVQLEFLQPPQVGRTEVTVPTEPKDLHGMIAPGAGPGMHEPAPKGEPPPGHPPVPPPAGQGAAPGRAP